MSARETEIERLIAVIQKQFDREQEYQRLSTALRRYRSIWQRLLRLARSRWAMEKPVTPWEVRHQELSQRHPRNHQVGGEPHA